MSLVQEEVVMAKAAGTPSLPLQGAETVPARLPPLCAG